ncbi:ParA family protein [Streptomyces alkaliphilus]|uniref:ParA family protein n=1 Tax=Streptomyces alkaliphilus TaxID=1472722 RepID=UPI002B2193DE|nr:ParA family protein [Streptomyces alkaliphilus]
MGGCHQGSFVKSIALFNNKGGVGKATLTYHLAHMMQRIGLSVLVVDLDPQTNLTAMCLDESEIEDLWGGPPGSSTRVRRWRLCRVPDECAVGRPWRMRYAPSWKAPETSRLSSRLACDRGSGCCRAVLI